MTEKQELSFEETFDYIEYYRNQKFSDCKVIITNEDGSETTINSHIIILSNASEFFYNVFTSNMQESKEGIVRLSVNPLNLLPRVFEWMYSGELLIENSEQLLALLEISTFYVIDQLRQELINIIESNIDPPALFQFTGECQRQGYTNIMQLFYSIYVKLYQAGKISIAEMSENLTCVDFAAFIKKLGLSNENAIPLITEFYGSYEGSDEEKLALVHSLDTSDHTLRRKLFAIKPPWVPPQFYK